MQRKETQQESQQGVQLTREWKVISWQLLIAQEIKLDSL